MSLGSGGDASFVSGVVVCGGAIGRAAGLSLSAVTYLGIHKRGNVNDNDERLF